ncbi:uncharacterized protein LOC106658432 [Trichogramma pretiosum]|uniref:uncharacterized protein LOC106658432 n=1 Tax=Trichogramma pretiosum TaxID=7493 RepID=UPI000C71C937|nr:uncharacterized protein LOC106658432 [Trichogramma pretiosum]
MIATFKIVHFFSIILFFYEVSSKKLRIEGGTYDYQNKYKYQISIQKRSKEDGYFYHVCGGAIISNFHILTAAHCFVREDYKADLDNYQIKAGTSNVNAEGIVRSINSVVIDRTYPKKLHVDIAVIELKNSLNIKRNSKDLSKIDLPTGRTESYKNCLARVTGFGLNGYKREIDANGKEVLIPKVDPWRRFIDVKIIDAPRNIVCRSNKILCVAGNANVFPCPMHQRVCPGDSGGPLVYENAIIGVLSRANQNMTPEDPGFFIKVSTFLDFIRQAMANEKRGIVKCGGSPVTKMLIITYSILFVMKEVTCMEVSRNNIDKDNMFRYQVSIQLRDEAFGKFRHICGGAIISEYFVLSAAHCFIVESDEESINVADRQLRVVAGTNKLYSNHGEAVFVQAVVVKEKYIKDPYPQDIALLKLETPLDVLGNVFIKVISLPTDAKIESFKNKRATISGFGAVGYTKFQNKSMNKSVELPILPEMRYFLPMKIVTIFSDINCPMSKQLLCAKVDLPKYDICTYVKQNVGPGDSGSPLELDNEVIGILSRGPICSKGQSLPAIFIKVSHFLGFIRTAMNMVDDQTIGIVFMKKSCSKNALMSCFQPFFSKSDEESDYELDLVPIN